MDLCQETWHICQLAQSMGADPRWTILATALGGQEAQNWLAMELLGQAAHRLALALLGVILLVLLHGLGIGVGHLHGLH